MPSKNSRKQYADNGYYHIYNRGVEKRKLFLDHQDYSVFLSYLKEYLIPKDIDALMKLISDNSTSPSGKDKARKLLRLNNFHEEISLLSYCLMPNHFHFLIKQSSPNSIDKFMNSLATRYTMYFNRKYKRVGTLYQEVYKAVLVDTNEQLLYLTKYIHKQALALQGEALQSGQPCSYDEYIHKRKTEWVKPDEILSYFSSSNPKLSYENFVKGEDDYSPITNFLLEDSSE